MYDSELMFEKYHLIKDKGTANYYIHPNKLNTTIGLKPQNQNLYKKMPNRKPIDTFFKANDSRFDVIEKSPKCMTNVKKVTGVFFSGYDKRGPLFPETDIATFYDSNKEATMKGLKAGALPWKRMTRRPAVTVVTTETPEDCYDYSNAMAVKTVKNKPRSVALANFGK